MARARVVTVTLTLAGCLVLAGAGVPARAGEPGADRARVEFFESKVRPVLANNCFGCHGSEKQKGNLRLDSISTMRAGGDSGPAIVPGDPEQSLLIEAVRYEGAVQMPPKKKLKAAEIEALVEWVKQGAAWPEAEKAIAAASVPSGRTITAEDRAFWSFQPVKDTPPPAVKDEAWPRSTIDAFVLAKLEPKGLHPAPQADRRTLIRRATFDLIGLPPTPEEVQAFLADDAPDAFARVVDRLLASPHYGERWARHWLDVARYGEDQAHSFQPRLYPQGFRYRDWLIQAFNADMPYNRFITEQVAGDLLDEPDTWKRLPALGFFALGPVYYGDAKKLDQMDDRIDTMSRGFLGLTVACARCHDHKYDPIPTTDYYALAGVFASTVYEEAPFAPPAEVEAYNKAQAAIKAKDDAIRALLKPQVASTLEPRLRAIEPMMLAVWDLRLRGAAGDGTTVEAYASQQGLEPGRLAAWYAYLTDTSEKARARAHLKPWLDLLARHQPSADLIGSEAALLEVQAVARQLERKARDLLAKDDALGLLIADLAPPPPATPKAQAAAKGLPAADRRLLDDLFARKGLLGLAKNEVEPALPEATRGTLADLRKQRDELKQAAPPAYPVVHTLKDGSKPIDMHVLVRGNPDTPGPESPRRFLSILGGQAPFRQGSGRLELAQAIASPDNPLTARVLVNRVWQHHFGRGLVGTPSNFGALGERPSHPELLDHLAYQFVSTGWSIKALHREIMLSATYQQSSAADPRAQELDPENRLLSHMSRRRLEVEAWRDAMLAVSGRLDPTVGGPSIKLDEPTNCRRTVYAAISRHDLAPLLRLFDFPDPNITSAERTRTTVALQQLLVLNDEFMIQSAKALAARLAAAGGADDAARIRRAYELLFGRPATEQELALGQAYLAAPEADPKAAGDLTRWERYAQVLLGTSEFLFVD